MHRDWVAVDNLQEWVKVPELAKWLKPIKDSTKRQYLVAMRLFQSWAGMGAKALIDEAEADLKKDRRERGKPTQRLLDYYAYLTEKHKTTKGKVGISPYKASVIIGALKSFYRNNGFPLVVKLPKVAPRKENRREEFDLPEVKKLLEVLPTQRDRAMALFGLQGGFDVGTASSLNVGDIQEKDLQPLLRGEMPETPILLRVVREKEGVDYETCLGRDAVEALRLYLAERKRRGEELTLDSPLFAKEGIGKRTGERVTPHLVQITMRKAVLDAGITTEERLQRADINVYGYHALRGTFSRRLDYAGMPVHYVNFMQGHQLPYGGAYNRPAPKKLLDLYREFEPVLSVSGATGTGREIEAKVERLEKGLEQRDDQVRGMEERLAFIQKLLEEHGGIYKDELEIQRVEGYRPTGPLGKQPGGIVGWGKDEKKPRRRGEEGPAAKG